MANCDYEVGDKVQNHGICGTVVEVTLIGNGAILTVEADGQKYTWDCDQVEPC